MSHEIAKHRIDICIKNDFILIQMLFVSNYVGIFVINLYQTNKFCGYKFRTGMHANSFVNNSVLIIDKGYLLRQQFEWNSYGKPSNFVKF